MANILIVEDEPQMRRLLEISLGEDGHTYRLRRRGKRSCTPKHWRIVVTDLKLPGMNGLEFLQEAKRLNPARHYGDDCIRQRGNRGGSHESGRQ